MHYVSREIGIDAAHREHQHGSKCFNIHGHRYKIQAVCSGGLATDGEQADMVVDFSFLKEAMMRQIDSFCDHGSIFSLDDPNIGSYVHGTGLAIDVDADHAFHGARWSRLAAGGVPQ